MNGVFIQDSSGIFEKSTSMQAFGQAFIEELPRHLKNLKIPGRLIDCDFRSSPLRAQIEYTTELQGAMREVLYHPVTHDAQSCAERAFKAFLEREVVDAGVLRFFNGWNETHKTTSPVSAKIIMRLAADARFMPVEKQEGYSYIMAHMHEVAKDDFGLGHEGHDGMYAYMTAAFEASGWEGSRYAISECCEFSRFLYDIGVAKHKSAMTSLEHRSSIMNAMMVSIASELWNGCEYNFIAQFIEKKLISIRPSLRSDVKKLRDAKGYVLGHSGEVESKHGMHALAAAQAFGRTVDLGFQVGRLKEVMLDYNSRVGAAFQSLHKALSE